jgi:hypothetical protein
MANPDDCCGGEISEHGGGNARRLAVTTCAADRTVSVPHYGLHLTPSEALVLAARLREGAEEILAGRVGA